MRSMLRMAPFVCSVPSTWMPVSAAVSAREIVSRSRISPTMIRSGSSRTALRSASAKVGAWSPISRWRDHALLVAMHELDRILDGDDVPLASSR